MRLESIMMLLATSTVVSTVTLSSAAFSHAVWRYRNADALKGSDFAALRREALILMPRGSPLTEAQDKLTAIGFACIGTPHGLPNINAPSLVCGSNGRGTPGSQQINVTVVSRNGLVSDIEIWNIFERADAETEVGAARSR